QRGGGRLYSRASQRRLDDDGSLGNSSSDRYSVATKDTKDRKDAKHNKDTKDEKPDKDTKPDKHTHAIALFPSTRSQLRAVTDRALEPLGQRLRFAHDDLSLLLSHGHDDHPVGS